jgi:hypothetical protein
MVHLAEKETMTKGRLDLLANVSQALNKKARKVSQQGIPRRTTDWNAKTWERKTRSSTRVVAVVQRKEPKPQHKPRVLARDSECGNAEHD